MSQEENMIERMKKEMMKEGIKEERMIEEKIINRKEIETKSMIEIIDSTREMMAIDLEITMKMKEDI
jgi:hypothetical protein